MASIENAESVKEKLVSSGIIKPLVDYSHFADDRMKEHIQQIQSSLFKTDKGRQDMESTGM
jgi:hypothetical protein